MIDTQHSQTGEDFCSQMLQGKTHSEKNSSSWMQQHDFLPIPKHVVYNYSSKTTTKVDSSFMGAGIGKIKA